MNEQEKLPVSFERHAEDVKSLGPDGSSHTSEAHASLRFGEVIAQFDLYNSDPTEYMRQSDLLKLFCSVTGACYARSHAINQTRPSPLALGAR